MSTITLTIEIPAEDAELLATALDGMNIDVPAGLTVEARGQEAVDAFWDDISAARRELSTMLGTSRPTIPTLDLHEGVVS